MRGPERSVASRRPGSRCVSCRKHPRCATAGPCSACLAGCAGSPSTRLRTTPPLRRHPGVAAVALASPPRVRRRLPDRVPGLPTWWRPRFRGRCSTRCSVTATASSWAIWQAHHTLRALHPDPLTVAVTGASGTDRIRPVRVPDHGRAPGHPAGAPGGPVAGRTNLGSRCARPAVARRGRRARAPGRRLHRRSLHGLAQGVGATEPD